MQEIKADHSYLSIADLAEVIRKQKVSSTEIVKGCLKRIERLNPALNAFIEVTGEHALNEAQAVDADIKSGNWKGPLHGIPVGIKDMFDTAGIRTTAAFEFFKDRVPERDAEVVAKLKAAGAIVIGKTNMHQLATGTTSVISYFGSVHNPWNTDYIAGGSSGGSAAALAAGLCYATIDTDAVGSCRLPASCCGVTGFKGTYGLISGRGILEGEPVDEMILRLAHTAFMVRTAGDAAILLNILADSEIDYASTLRTTERARIGIVQNFQATEEVRTHFLNTVGVFKTLGFAATHVNVPFESAAFRIDTIEKDRKNISALLFKDIDALILPTTVETAPTIDEAQKRENTKGQNDVAFSANNTFFCNYYGLPAITVPCGFDKNGSPLGLQIVGPPNGESKVLDIANRFQKATRWHLMYPSVSN